MPLQRQQSIEPTQNRTLISTESMHSFGSNQQRLTMMQNTSQEASSEPQRVPNIFPEGTTLRTGARGELVQQLQKALKNKGFPLSTDGVYGRGTQDAVRAYQSQQGLEADGVAGPDTLSTLEPTANTTGPATTTSPSQSNNDASLAQTGQDTSKIEGNDTHLHWAEQLMAMRNMGVTVPEKTVRQIRGEMAAKQSRLTYQEGQKKHGTGSWETNGSNRGPLITPLKEANRATSKDNYEWCGMFVGHSFKKAGIRDEILRSLVFWSGYRLHLFFTKGEDVNNKKIGDFWQPHTNLQLNFTDDTRRKEAFDDFAPEAGDVVLFGSSYDHVAIVDSYDAETGKLEILEGNSGNRVQATTFGSGDDRISFIGRFNDSDFGNDVDSNLLKKENPDIQHNDKRNGRISWQDTPHSLDFLDQLHV